MNSKELLAIRRDSTTESSANPILMSSAIKESCPTFLAEAAFLSADLGIRSVDIGVTLFDFAEGYELRLSTTIVSFIGSSEVFTGLDYTTVT